MDVVVEEADRVVVEIAEDDDVVVDVADDDDVVVDVADDDDVVVEVADDDDVVVVVIVVEDLGEVLVEVVEVGVEEVVADVVMEVEEDVVVVVRPTSGVVKVVDEDEDEDEEVAVDGSTSRVLAKRVTIPAETGTWISRRPARAISYTNRAIAPDASTDAMTLPGLKRMPETCPISRPFEASDSRIEERNTAALTGSSGLPINSSKSTSKTRSAESTPSYRLQDVKKVQARSDVEVGLFDSNSKNLQIVRGSQMRSEVSVGLEVSYSESLHTVSE